MNPVILKNYDANYPAIFQKEKGNLINILKKLNFDFHIEHIGSTAVPGLAGKGIIDIAIGLKNWGYLPLVLKTLIAAGFCYKETAGSEFRRFLSDKPLSEKVTFHYHIMPKDSMEYKNALLFRDNLIRYPHLAKEYLNLKNRLAKKAKTPREYLLGKNEFIQKVLAIEP